MPQKPTYEELEQKIKELDSEVIRRKQAEDALHQEQEKFRFLIEELPFAVSFIDNNAHYKYINPRFIEIFGYTLEDIPDGRQWFKKAYPDGEYRRKVIANWISDLGNSRVGITRSQSYNVRCKNGLEKVIHFRSVTMENGEQFILYEDISEQKQLEAQYQQSQKMEAVGTLAGGIAHDFNNLLQSILGYCQLLLFKKQKDHPEFAKLKEIEKATLRASELTLQLLTFSRKVESKLRPVNLNHQVEHIHKLLKRTIPKMIDIELHLEEKLKIINADPAQIEQVLMNLAVNARDAIHEEGKLIIETENVTLDEDYCKTHLGTRIGEHVLLIVSDTGAGMDRETADHIFEPFFTTKGMGKGTGLGLSMVYGIINSHGGYISCYSEPGEGTTFKIYLPVIDAEIKEEILEQKEEIIPAGGSEAIILVDDEEFILELGEEILSKFGYRVYTAPDAESALKIYQEMKNSISLIILDLIMPGMGGRRCLEELMKMNPSLKVIIASGFSVNGPAKEILQSGAKGFIDKPYDVKQMLNMVREVLDEN
ncbi:MAG: response regulator [Deltaproteobacteria bacterium]|nr:response regulator [Deltaproteobacteria bacterium]